MSSMALAGPVPELKPVAFEVSEGALALMDI